MAEISADEYSMYVGYAKPIFIELSNTVHLRDWWILPGSIFDFVAALMKGNCLIGVGLADGSLLCYFLICSIWLVDVVTLLILPARHRKSSNTRPTLFNVKPLSSEIPWYSVTNHGHISWFVLYTALALPLLLSRVWNMGRICVHSIACDVFFSGGRLVLV